MFDSHVSILLDTAVSLVNALTDGDARGRPYTVPRGAELVDAVRTAVPPASTGQRTIDQEQAAYLTRAARELRKVFEAVSTGSMDDAATAVNALLLANGARPQLDRADGGPWRLHFHGADDSPAVKCGAACATGLAIAIGSDLVGRLGVCQATRCDRVYVDTSRNAARQFCSTACQNRTKAAAFRTRRTAVR